MIGAKYITDELKQKSAMVNQKYPAKILKREFKNSRVEYLKTFPEYIELLKLMMIICTGLISYS